MLPDSVRRGRLLSHSRSPATDHARPGAGIVNVIADSTETQYVRGYLNDTGVDAAFLYTYGACYSGLEGRVTWVGQKPVIGGRFSLWGNGTAGQCLGTSALVAALKSQPKDPSSASGYSLIPVHAWCGTAVCSHAWQPHSSRVSSAGLTRWQTSSPLPRSSSRLAASLL